jgi:hypothetical protein
MIAAAEAAAPTKNQQPYRISFSQAGGEPNDG